MQERENDDGSNRPIKYRFLKCGGANEICKWKPIGFKFSWYMCAPISCHTNDFVLWVPWIWFFRHTGIHSSFVNNNIKGLRWKDRHICPIHNDLCYLWSYCRMVVLHFINTIFGIINVCDLCIFINVQIRWKTWISTADYQNGAMRWRKKRFYLESNIRIGNKPSKIIFRCNMFSSTIKFVLSDIFQR